MRVLLDECVDERLRNFFVGHECQTARYAGLAGLKNGELLSAAEASGFEVFVTVDQGIEYPQNLSGRRMAILVFVTKSNRLKDLLPLIPECLAGMEAAAPGEIVRIAKPA